MYVEYYRGSEVTRIGCWEKCVYGVCSVAELRDFVQSNGVCLWVCLGKVWCGSVRCNVREGCVRRGVYTCLGSG